MPVLVKVTGELKPAVRLSCHWYTIAPVADTENCEILPRQAVEADGCAVMTGCGLLKRARNISWSVPAVTATAGEDGRKFRVVPAKNPPTHILLLGAVATAIPRS